MASSNCCRCCAVSRATRSWLDSSWDAGFACEKLVAVKMVDRTMTAAIKIGQLRRRDERGITRNMITPPGDQLSTTITVSLPILWLRLTNKVHASNRYSAPALQ